MTDRSPETETEADAKTAIEGWLLAHTSHPIERIAHDQDIVTGRILDSLRFVDLILLIEELSGRPVDRAGLDMNGLGLDDFRTIDAIWNRFFKTP